MKKTVRDLARDIQRYYDTESIGNFNDDFYEIADLIEQHVGFLFDVFDSMDVELEDFDG